MLVKSVENLSIIVAFGGGFLSFLSPCVLPLLPSYLAFVTGVSVDDLKTPLLGRELRKKVVLNSLCFILGFSMVFVLLGASFSFLGRFFAIHQNTIQKIAGLVIIFFGLYITGIFNIPLFMRSKELLPIRTKPAGYAGSTLVGLSFASAWTPCVGPILGAILALAGSEGKIRGGIVLLAAYSMGLAIPFFLTSVASGSLLSAFQRFTKFTRAIYIGGGILLIIVGLLILTGYFTVLNSLFIGLTPSWLLEKI